MLIDRKVQIVEEIAKVICTMPNKCNDCSAYECQAKDLAERLYNEKISKAAKIEIHYDPPYEYKFAVVEYYARQGKPLKVVSYYNYGKELKTGKSLRCWTGYPSTNWSIIEDNFATELEAELRMKEIREARRGR